MLIDILKGLGVTFFLTIACFITASFIGILTCIGFYAKNRIIRTAVKIYNGIIIKIPPLVMLMLFSFIIIEDTDISSLLTAYVALSLFVAANITGVFFSGVSSVAKGEIDAARTLGMNKRQAFFHIMLPQIIKNIIPVYMSMFVMCMQITSVASVIGVKEILSTSGSMPNIILGTAISIICYFLIGSLGDIAISSMGRRRHIRSADFIDKPEVL